MKNDLEEPSLSSLLADVNSVAKIDVKATGNALKIRRIVGNSKIELGEPFECSAVLDFSMVYAAFQYYNFKKNERNTPFEISNLSKGTWDKNYALRIETDCSQPVNSNNDVEKTLSELPMDVNSISEKSKFNVDTCNFLNDQMELSDILGEPSNVYEHEMDKNEYSNSTVISFETYNSDLKDYSNSSGNNSSDVSLETGNSNFEVKSVIAKPSVPSSQHFTNVRENNSFLKCFHGESYFPGELDYEPSDTGDTETKEKDSEFCIDNILREEGNGSFLNYCLENVASEISTFQEKFEEIDLPEKHTEICTHEDFVSFFQSNLDPVSSESNLQNNTEKWLVYDDDDSESDSEHSFKRISSRNKQLNNQEALKQPLKISKVSRRNSIDEVNLDIYEQCKSGNINEAIVIANKYIAISVESVQLEIFKQMFINVINFIKSSVPPIDDAKISKYLGDIMTIYHQTKLFNSDLCSLIITECFNCDWAIKTGREFFSFIQRIKVPVSNNAISSFVDNMMPSELPTLELISFMEYMKYVCNFPCPETLLSEALERFSKQKENSMLVGFFRLCKFLCSVSSTEVDINKLQHFVEFCIKNDYWIQIANFFQAWYTDNNLICCLSRSFLFWSDDVGNFYEKLAEEIYRFKDVPFQLVGILGQMGVFMMLEVFSQKQYQSAFKILFTLHKCNINYLDLQACLYNAPKYLKNFPNFFDVFVFPFDVAFAALDICLHLKRFKDAYCIFKSFSLNLPAYMEETLKLKVRYKRFGYLLKLTQELYSKEPLKLGLQAFHDMCLVAKDFTLEELENSVEEMQTIYNKYLTYTVNGCHLDTVLELFEYSGGGMKEIFIIHSQVLRGLLVTFAQNDRMDVAYKLFSLECARKVYNIEQARTEDSNWCLTIMSSWTVSEVGIVIRNFMTNIFLSWDGKYKTGFDMKFSAKIMFQKSDEDCFELVCLKKSNDLDSSKEIVCKVLLSLDSHIKWVENQNPLCLDIVSDTIYNFWMKTSSNILWLKNPRKYLFEDMRPNAEFKIQSNKEDVDCKYSTESNNVKPMDAVFSQLTPEYSVADQTPTPAKATVSESTVLRSKEQEPIVSYSEQISPVAHSSKTFRQTIDGKIDFSESNLTENANQVISERNARKVRTQMKIFRCLKSRNVSKAAKPKNKCKRIRLKKCNHKKPDIIQSLSKTKNQRLESPKHVSKPWRNEHFRITLENSAQDGGSRVVNQASEAAPAEPRDTTNVSNVPDAVFQRIVLFLRSKVMLKCKDLQPLQQQEKVNHLANLFIQKNVVVGLDKKTMKLLSEFAEGCI